MTTKQIIITVVVALAALVVGYMIPHTTSGLMGAVDCGSSTCFTSLGVTTGVLEADGGFKLGSDGSTITQQIVTTCNPIANTSVSATSTAYIYCTGITGVTSSSQVFAQFSTSTNAIGAQWSIIGSKASTTAGIVDIKIMNLTGTAAVPSAAAGAQFASSTKLIVIN